MISDVYLKTGKTKQTSGEKTTVKIRSSLISESRIVDNLKKFKSWPSKIQLVIIGPSQKISLFGSKFFLSRGASWLIDFEVGTILD